MGFFAFFNIFRCDPVCPHAQIVSKFSREMAKAKNHTAHNQSSKAHMNRIKKPWKHSNTSTKGVRNYFFVVNIDFGSFIIFEFLIFNFYLLWILVKYRWFRSFWDNGNHCGVLSPQTKSLTLYVRLNFCFWILILQWRVSFRCSRILDLLVPVLGTIQSLDFKICIQLFFPLEKT